MLLRRFAFFALASLPLLPACSAIVNPDTTRLGPTGDDTGMGSLDAGGHDAGRPDDGAVTCATGCDDGVACTTDSCVMNACQHAPNDAACGAGMHCTATGCVPNGTMPCTSDAQCSDDNVCNGIESCHPGQAGANAMGCLPGQTLSCDDHIACTTDACAPATGCSHTASDAACNSGCFVGATCQIGMGCVGGTTMMCVADGNGCTSDPPNCDVATGMCLHPPRDDDGDGYPTAIANGMPCPGGTDCDDADAAVHPGADEVCNGMDDDCDMMIDEGGVCGTPAPDNCTTEQAIMLTRGVTGMLSGSVTGTTVGDTDDYRTTCSANAAGEAPPNGAGDAVYYVDVPPSGTFLPVDVTISTNNPGTDFDSVLGAVVGTCSAAGFASATGGGTTARCNDDVSGMIHTSSLTLCLAPSASGPARIQILVDGYMQGAEGNFDLTVTVTPHAGPTCP